MRNPGITGPALVSLLLIWLTLTGCGQGGGVTGGTLGGGVGSNPLSSTGPQTSVVEGQVSFTWEGKSYSGTADKNGWFFINLEDAAPKTMDIKITYGTLSNTTTVKVTEKSDTHPGQTAKWGVYAYLNGTNDLEQFCLENLKIFEKMGSTQNVSVVVALSRAAIGGACDVFFMRSEDQVPEKFKSGVVCGRVLKKDSSLMVEQIPAHALLLSHQEKADMAGPENLTAFMDLATARCPSVYSMLVIASHGGGYKNIRTGYQYLAYDSISDSVLNLKELQSALSRMKTRIHILGFDTCCVGSIETAWQLKDSLNPKKSIIIASADTIPPEGWPYEEILAKLRENASYDPPGLASFITSLFASEHRRKGDDRQVLAAYDMAKLKSLASPLEEVASRLAKYAAEPEGLARIKEIRSLVKTMEDGDLVDLGDLLARLAALDDSKIAQPAARALEHLKAAVIAQGRASTEKSESLDISIFFPARAGDTGSWKDAEGNPYESLDFSSSRGVPSWHRVLSVFNNGLVPMIFKVKPPQGRAGARVNVEGIFGGEKGSLMVGGQETPVSGWTENLITFQIPQAKGPREVCITAGGRKSNGVIINVEQ